MNTPPPRERSGYVSSSPSPERDGSSSPTATTNVQRFSLRSRSARLRLPRRTGAPSCKRLLSRDALESERISECIVDPCLGAGRRPLCKEATDDHDEFQLLELLNTRFIADCRTGGKLITSKAGLSDINISFILDPLSNAAMTGGVKLGDDLVGVSEASCGKLPLLSQLYVESHARRKGLATAALRVLLAGHSAAVVDCPSLATAKAMLRLGFKAVGTKLLEEGRRVLYVRLEALGVGLHADENS